MNRDTARQIANVIAVIVTLAINALANIIPFNGQTTGEISDRFEVYFVPAGYVFSIWGVIYLGLVVFAIYQALPGQAANPRLRRIGGWFLVSCIANSAWIPLWHYNQFLLTLPVMLLLLASLLIIYTRLDIGRARVGAAERWSVDVLFSVYLGWISVATIANVTDVLDYLGFQGGGIGPQVWAVIMLLTGVVLGALMLWQRRDLAYVLVLIWAFAGIGVSQADAPLVANSAWVATGVLVLLFVAGLFNRPRPIQALA